MDYIWKIKLIAVFVCGILLSTDLSAAQNCRDCVLNGIKFPPNKPFEYRVDCIEMTGCFCYCDGSSVCERERNICDRTVESARDFRSNSRTRYQSSSSSSSSSSSMSSGSGSQGGVGSGQVITDVKNEGCQKCIVDGGQIDGGTYFSHINGCISYSSCYCGCDGKWQCPAQNAKNTCTGTGSGSIIGSDDSGCRSCVIDGVPYVGNSDFTYRNNCLEWTDCRCRCDGSWRCASNSARWICENVCRECEVDERKYPGKTQFRYEKECTVYDPCTCHCNGSWDCPAQNGKWICTDKCLECSINGRKYTGNSDFSLREDCWEWDPCRCKCDGSWECPRENAKWVCTEQCLECDVNGKKYKGNTLFQYVEGCYEYNCNCRCDGGWSCPANRTRDRCRLNMATGCYFCNVNDEKFEGNSLFSYEDKCIKYNKCTCNCDGSWECPGERAINTCARNSTTGCNYCDVYGQHAAGNTRFEIQQDCWRFDCECDCNGNWRCSETGATYVCGSQLLDTSGCKSCLAEGQRFPGQSTFEITWGCVTHQCTCNCDGSWICPSRLSKNICSNSHFQNFLIRTITNLPNSWCTECTIGGSVYPGYSQLEYQEKCTRQYARCYCNGGYRFDSSVITGCTGRTQISIAKGNCIECILNNEVYAANSEFEISSQCKRYRCKCECNGRAACQSVTDNVCGTVLTTIRSSQFITRGGSESVIVGGGGSSTTTVERGGGGTRGTATVITSGGGTRGSETIVTGGGGSRTVVVGGGTTGQTTGTRTVVVDDGRKTGSRTVVVGGGGGTSSISSKETRVVVTSGGGTHTVVRGGGSSTNSDRTVVQVSGSGTSQGGAVITTGGSICYHCVGLDGKKYPGNSDFTFRRGCAVWKCQCNCNGRAVCRPHDLSACLVEPQCRNCVVDGRSYRSNRMFSYEKDCVLHQCRCMCDGRPRCVQTVAFDCEPEKDRCAECVINGRRYQSNAMFDLETKCTKQRCQCDCSGQYRCSRAVNTCGDDRTTNTCQPCIVEGKSYSAGTSFQVDRGCYRMTCSCSCRDRLTCDQSATVNICDNTARKHCQACTVDGERYPPNSKFEREVNCMRHQCQCLCDGKYDCVSTGINICGTSGTRTRVDTTRTTTTPTSPGRTVNVKTETSSTSQSGSSGTSSTSSTSSATDNRNCKPCIADRIERSLGTTFCLERGCKRYSCECYCNGRYACQTDKPENICDEAGKVIKTPCPTRTITRKRTDTSRDRDTTRTRTESNRGRDTTNRQTETSRGRETSEGSRQTTGGTRTTSTTTETRTSETSSASSTTVFDFQERRGGVAVSTTDRRGRCMQCNIQETIYKGNSEFYLQLGCKRFRCTCNCDATWQCPRQRPENTCQQETCRPCTLRGKEHPPNSRFTVDIDQCRKYQCTCPCNGRYSCPSEDIINTCDSNAAQCKECNVNGNRYQSNAEFSYDDGCNRFNCICNCDGSYECPASKTVNICNNPDTGRCRQCEVKGQTYRGNTRFSYDEDCFRYNCDCNCDGSWNCPASRTVNICNNPDTGRCRQCEVKGQTYQGNTRFSYDEDCFRYNCDCKCDGSWNCPASRTVNICNNPDTGRCRQCEVKGQTYQGNTRFSYDEDCFRYNCDCKCDGSWNCPASRTVNICTNPDTGRCRQCEVKGKKYRGNTRFSYDEDCFRYNCDCNCDGSWNCPASRTERICENPTTSTVRCRECEVKGKRYRGNTRFSYDEDCYRYNCDCKCDGSYDCPASRTVNICRDQCRQCEVEGKRYSPNGQFRYDKDCYRFTCDCQCDGSYNCPSSRTQRICDNRGNRLSHFSVLDYADRRRTESRQTSGAGSHSTSQGGTSRTESRQTSGSGSNSTSQGGSSRTESSRTESKRVSETHSSSGSQTSSSSSEAGGSQTITEIRSRSGSTSGSRVDSRGCRSCIVNSVEYRSNADFQFEDNCFRFKCECRCDGSWSCPASRTVNICPDSCRECRVKGKNYPANTIFEYDEGCNRFNCDCSCDGSYNCPADRTKDICGGRRDKCRDCEVEGQKYPPNRRFQYAKGCFRYNCDCKCDGSWRCPSDRSTNICSGVESRSCSECRVKGKRYPPNKEFSYIDDCNLNKCTCNCDGSYNCPSTTDICRSSGQICRDCLVNGKRYLPNKPFSYTDRCERFNCDCLCNGSWNCPAERTTNLCTSGQCSTCKVRNRSYQGNSVFVITENCRQFQCQCHCDGQWQCSKESVNVCNSG